MDTATQERIAEQALLLFEDEGENAVSMRRVASGVGITPMAIYHHFEDRKALLDYVVDREFQSFLGSISQVPQKGSYETRLAACMDAYVDYALARPRIFDYVFSAPRTGARRYPKDFRERRSPTLNPVADLVKEAMDAGVLKKDDMWEVALELWAHAHGYVSLYRGGRFDLPENEFRTLIRRSMRRLIYGLRSGNKR